MNYFTCVLTSVLITVLTTELTSVLTTVLTAVLTSVLTTVLTTVPTSVLTTVLTTVLLITSVLTTVLTTVPPFDQCLYLPILLWAGLFAGRYIHTCTNMYIPGKKDDGDGIRWTRGRCFLGHHSGAPGRSISRTGKNNNNNNNNTPE